MQRLTGRDSSLGILRGPGWFMGKQQWAWLLCSRLLLAAHAVPHLWWADTFTGATASLLTFTMGFRVGGLTLHFFLLDGLHLLGIYCQSQCLYRSTNCTQAFLGAFTRLHLLSSEVPVVTVNKFNK